MAKKFNFIDLDKSKLPKTVGKKVLKLKIFSTHHTLIKVPKVLRPTNKISKSLGKSIIQSPVSSPFLGNIYYFRTRPKVLKLPEKARY